jgi:hypothetical protein
MESFCVLALLETSIGGGAVVLDALTLLIALAMIVGGARLARRLTAWRIERRMGTKRGTWESEEGDTLRKLAELRDSGSLSEEEFEAARARVLND